MVSSCSSCSPKSHFQTVVQHLCLNELKGTEQKFRGISDERVRRIFCLRMTARRSSVRNGHQSKRRQRQCQKSRARSLDHLFWLARNTFGAKMCEMRENKVPRHQSRPSLSPFDDFARFFTLSALDDDEIRPYYSNSVLWTSEMDYITTIISKTEKFMVE